MLLLGRVLLTDWGALPQSTGKRASCSGATVQAASICGHASPSPAALLGPLAAAVPRARPSGEQ